MYCTLELWAGTEQAMIQHVHVLVEVVICCVETICGPSADIVGHPTTTGTHKTAVSFLNMATHIEYLVTISDLTLQLSGSSPGPVHTLLDAMNMAEATEQLGREPALPAARAVLQRHLCLLLS